MAAVALIPTSMVSNKTLKRYAISNSLLKLLKSNWPCYILQTFSIDTTQGKAGSMSDRGASEKILEKSPLNGIAVPVAIILVGALIVFGVTRMLSTERSHRDLISEMHSKTFGNRWVAAYELSKLLASKSIASEEIPWVIENLSAIYRSSADSRTRNFIVIAVGSLERVEGLELLSQALEDPDDKVKFNAIVAQGNMPVGSPIDWMKLENFLGDEDKGLVQAAILALSQHKIQGANEKIRPFLKASEKPLRYSAALGLINYQEVAIEPVLNEMMMMDDAPVSDPSQRVGKFNGAQIEALKLNVLNALQKNKWDYFNPLIKKVAREDKNVKISTKAKEVLNLLKN